MQLLLFAALLLTFQDSEKECLRALVDRLMPRYDDAQRKKAFDQLWAAFDKLTDPAQRTRAIRHIEFTVGHSSRAMVNDPAYRDIHARHPHLESLDFPDAQVLADYDIGIRWVETSLALVALAERRKPSDVDGLKDQIRELTEHARRLFADKVRTETAMSMIEHLSAARRTSLQKTADVVHMGYHRQLTPDEMNSIKSVLADSIGSMDEIDPEPPRFVDDVKRVEDALKPLFMVDHFQRPGIRELEAERIEVTKRAFEVRNEAFARAGRAYHEILDRERPPREIDLRIRELMNRMPETPAAPTPVAPLPDPVQPLSATWIIAGAFLVLGLSIWSVWRVRDWRADT